MGCNSSTEARKHATEVPQAVKDQITEAATNVKTEVTNAAHNVKTEVTQAAQDAKTEVTKAVENTKTEATNEVNKTIESAKAVVKHTNQTEAFLASVQNRRTIYTLDKNIKISDEKIQETVEYIVKNTPSSFNSQAGRVKILLGGQSDKFWQGTKEILRGIVPADQFAATDAKMDGFAAGYGTILFFEDQNDVKKMQEDFPSYASAFPTFSEHSNAMMQFAVWCALENEGLGCSLQHYTPLVDELVQKEWNAPTNWKLIAQMPFGNPTAPAGDKTFKPIEERLQVHKA